MKYLKSLGYKLAYIVIGIILATAGVVYAAVSVPNSTGKGNWLSGLSSGNYQTNSPCSNGLVLAASSTSSTGWACTIMTSGSGSGSGVPSTTPFTSGYIPYATSTLALTNSLFYYTPSNGFTGLGTTTPIGRLTIQGMNNLSTGLPLSVFNASGTPTLVATNAGNVGIGTTSPITKLQVYGGQMRSDFYSNPTGLSDIEGNSALVLNNTLNNGIKLLAGLTSTESFLQSFNSTNNTARSLLLQMYGGNVGIGITSPNYKLEVAGTASATTLTLANPLGTAYGGTGSTTLNTTLVTEGTNLYFTNARAAGAISLTTTGTSGAATYNNTTGALNIPQYQAAGSYLTAAVTSLNGLTGASQTFATSTGGSLWTITSSGTVHTWNIPATPTFTGITVTNATTTNLSVNGTKIVGGMPARFWLASTTQSSIIGTSFGTATTTVNVPGLPYAYTLYNISGSLDAGGTVLITCGNGSSSSTPFSIGTTAVSTTTSVTFNAYQKAVCQIGSAASSPDGLGVTLMESPQ